MYTANLPRFTAIKANLWPIDTSKDWLISIADLPPFGSPAPIPEGKFERILFMHFYDTADEAPELGGITEEQALEIATFIKEAIAQEKNVWANCHAGVSRSGAVVRILMELGYEFKETGLSPFRLPNTLVYKRVSQHFEALQQSWSEKIMENRSK